MQNTKELLRTYFPFLWVLIKGTKFLFAKDSYLNKVGYIESILRARPCEFDGAPLPWMNYGMIGLLKDRISTKHSIFEYGSGNSTLFWARLAGTVVAVEHDKVWYDRIYEDLPSNVELKYRSERDRETYITSISESDDIF